MDTAAWKRQVSSDRDLRAYYVDRNLSFEVVRLAQWEVLHPDDIVGSVKQTFLLCRCFSKLCVGLRQFPTVCNVRS